MQLGRTSSWPVSFFPLRVGTARGFLFFRVPCAHLSRRSLFRERTRALAFLCVFSVPRLLQRGAGTGLYFQLFERLFPRTICTGTPLPASLLFSCLFVPWRVNLVETVLGEFRAKGIVLLAFCSKLLQEHQPSGVWRGKNPDPVPFDPLSFLVPETFRRFYWHLQPSEIADSAEYFLPEKLFAKTVVFQAKTILALLEDFLEKFHCPNSDRLSSLYCKTTQTLASLLRKARTFASSETFCVRLVSSSSAFASVPKLCENLFSVFLLKARIF